MKIRTAPLIVGSILSTLAALTGRPAFAQADSKPLTLTIRPQASVAEDPRARQEKLLRRLEQSDYWVRSICVQCGDAWKHQVYAPFNPLEALGRKADSEATVE